MGPPVVILGGELAEAEEVVGEETELVEVEETKIVESNEDDY